MILSFGMLALCLAFLLPGHYPPWISFQQQWLAALGVWVIGVGAVAAAKAGAVRWPRSAWFMIGIAALPLLQFAAGQVVFASDATVPSLFLTGFGLSMVAGASLSGTRRERFVDGICGVFVAAAILSTGLALFQWLQLGESLYVADLAPGERPFANLAQPNHLATLLALGVAALIRFYEARRIGGWVTTVATTWLGLGMLVTQSRTAWLFGGLVLIAWLVLHRRAKLRLTLLGVVSSLAVFFVAVFLWPHVVAALELSTVGAGPRLTSSGRTLIWPVLLHAVRLAPWFGYGWNQVTLAQQATALAHPSANYWFADSHNLFLDLVLWCGLPIGLLLSGLLILWFFKQIRSCTDSDRWTILLAVGAVLLHSMVEYPYDFAYFLLPIGLLMGFLDGEGEGANLIVLDRRVLALPLAFMLAMLGWLGAEYIKVEESYRQLRFVAARIGADRVAVAPVPRVVLLDGLREAHRFLIAEPRKGLSVAELKAMQEVAARYPNVPTLFRYALAEGLNGNWQGAERTLGILCKLNTREHCDEVRTSWAELQAGHAELRQVTFPLADAASPIN